MALYLPVITFDHLPLLIFGSASFVSAILAAVLPETLGAPLPESFDELAIIRKHSKPIGQWWSIDEVDENIHKINAARHSSPKKYDTITT